MSLCSGCNCTKPGCRGRMTTRSSRQSGDYQIRYLRCPTCGTSARSVVNATNARSIVMRRTGTSSVV